MTLEDEQGQKPVDTKPTYTEKTNRLLAWTQLLKSIAPLIWTIVLVIVIIPLIGQIFIAKAFSTKPAPSKPDTEIVIKQPDWSKVNEAVKLTLDNARNSAEAYASKELDVWVDELMQRVDNRFLDWYFGYFNQKQIEYKSLFVLASSSVTHLINPNSPNPETKLAEAITQDFQTEFAKRVLIPQTAQLRLERLAQKTVQYYLDELRGNINSISATYKIPQADWNRYLNQIAFSIYDTEGQTSNLTLKVLAGGGAYIALKPIVTPLVLKVGSKVTATMAGKAGAKIAAKSGAALAGKVASAVLDSTVGVGIILWDIWDNNHTANIERPILRANLAEYLQQVKGSLLTNPENGIMAPVRQIESLIVPNLSQTAV